MRGSPVQIALGTDEKRPSPLEWSMMFAQVARIRPDDVTFWKVFSQLIRNAQVFEFGRVADERVKSEASRGGQLWGHHLRLPFTGVIYWYDFLPDREADPVFDDLGEESLRFCTLAVQVPFDVEVANRGDSDRVGFTLAADFMMVPPSIGHESHTRHVFEIHTAIHFCAAHKDGRSQWFGKVIESSIPKGSKMEHRMMGGCADGVVSLSMVLATRGVPVRVEEPPAKVNAKREKNGKPPLTRVTHVDTTRYYEAMENTRKGGTHSSPVPHLRRGHPRMLHRGTPEQREVWIRDSLVNCRSLVELEASRDRYEVTVSK